MNTITIASAAPPQVSIENCSKKFPPQEQSPEEALKHAERILAALLPKQMAPEKVEGLLHVLRADHYVKSAKPGDGYFTPLCTEDTMQPRPASTSGERTHEAIWRGAEELDQLLRDSKLCETVEPLAMEDLLPNASEEISAATSHLMESADKHTSSEKAEKWWHNVAESVRTYKDAVVTALQEIPPTLFTRDSNAAKGKELSISGLIRYHILQGACVSVFGFGSA